MKQQNGKKNSLILTISVVVVLAAGIGAGALYSLTDTEVKSEPAQDVISSPATDTVENDDSDLNQVDSDLNQVDPGQEEGLQEDGPDETAVRVDSKPEYPGYIQDEGGCWAAGNGPVGGIRALYRSGDAYYIDVDLVEYYCGPQAIDEARKDGAEEVNNDYWIRNKNPRIYTFRLDADPVVVMNYNGANHDLNVSFDTWLTKFNGPDDALAMMEKSIKLNPYWLTFDGDRVNRLVMQFLP